MSGVAVGVPVASTQRRSFMRLLWAVLLGYFCTSIALVILALPLYAIDWLPRPFAYPGPFPVDGAWSLDADLVVAAVVVLVAAWFIRLLVEDAVKGPVSYGVVALAVALTGYAPYLALRPAKFLGIVALPLTTWVIRRYAIGTALPFPRPSWRLWLVLAVVGLVVFGSYRVYHPLTPADDGIAAFGATTYPNGKQFRGVDFKNSGWADMTILRVAGGQIGPTNSWPAPYTLPHKLRSGASLGVYVNGRACVLREVDVTFSVLGRTSTQRLTIQPDSDRAGFRTSADVIPAC
jgi:hypothetical protein